MYMCIDVCIHVYMCMCVYVYYMYRSLSLSLYIYIYIYVYIVLVGEERLPVFAAQGVGGPLETRSHLLRIR